MYKKIVVPLDGSALSEAVLPSVQAIVERSGAEIVLLRVVVYPAYDYLATDLALAPMIADHMDFIRRETQNYLEGIASRLRASGCTVTTQVHSGPIAETILTVAEDIHADLIAMSTHGRSGSARWLLGSVASKVVHGSTISVLLIRPKPQAEAVPSVTQARIERGA